MLRGKQNSSPQGVGGGKRGKERNWFNFFFVCKHFLEYLKYLGMLTDFSLSKKSGVTISLEISLRKVK